MLPQSKALVLRGPHCRVGWGKAPPLVLKQVFTSQYGSKMPELYTVTCLISSVVCRNHMSPTQAGFGYTLPVGGIVSLIYGKVMNLARLITSEKRHLSSALFHGITKLMH